MLYIVLFFKMNLVTPVCFLKTIKLLKIKITKFEFIFSGFMSELIKLSKIIFHIVKKKCLNKVSEGLSLHHQGIPFSNESVYKIVFIECLLNI